MGGRVETRLYIGDRVIVCIPRAALEECDLAEERIEELLQLNGQKGTVSSRATGSDRMAYVALDAYPGSGDDPLFRVKWLERVTVLDLLADIDSSHHQEIDHEV